MSEETIRAQVIRLTFYNQENGYAVIKARTNAEEIAIVGNCLSLEEGCEVTARGGYINHPKFGKQFKATSLIRTMPTTKKGILRYLSSGTIKGIGEKTAQKLVDAFGESTLEIIEKEPDKIYTLKGLNKARADSLISTLKNQSTEQNTIRYLLENGIPNNLALKIIKLYSDKTLERITANPYQLARDIVGVGFLTADSIAFKLGFPKEAPIRLEAGLIYTLEQSSDDGHCFLPESELLSRAASLLEIHELSSLEKPLHALVEQGDLKRGGDNAHDDLYLPNLYKAERFVAAAISARLKKNSDPNEQAEGAIATAISETEKELNLKLSYEQRATLVAANNNKLLIITGGPGCGKTTVIKALTKLFQKQKKELMLAAPTGRAAQRMSEVCSLPASTIHRLLGYDPFRRTFRYCIDEALPCDVLIIDESSMLDIPLAMHLLAALNNKTTLILVGDKDQLPSVGPGRFLGDLLSIREVPAIPLTQLFRRDTASLINTVAHQINSGIVPDLPTPSPQEPIVSDSYFIPRPTPETINQSIIRLVTQDIPRRFKINPEQIAVLAPVNKGAAGVGELNTALQAVLNPAQPGSVSITINSSSARIGDRVVQRNNNYQIHDEGVFNGDFGRIIHIEKDGSSLKVRLWDSREVTYTRSDFNQLSLAYAMTVHRSQGCEFQCVVMALHDSHYVLLERQLLYTGITRAKKLLVIVGSKRAIAIATRKVSSLERHTRLKALVTAELPR